MYKVLYNKKLNSNSYEMCIEAPMVVKKTIPGQFAIVMAKEDSERIPLTIYDYDLKKGLLYLIYQVVGASTEELTYIDNEIYSVLGPLGNPNEICFNIDKFRDKKIVYVAGGVGIAPVYPQVKYLYNHNINADIIYGARTKELLIIKDKIENISNNVRFATDDGSYGVKGNVVDVLKQNINNYDVVVAIGPVIMMKYVCELTKKYNIKTIVSMNPIMVDGSGMCGACRCILDGKEKFACIDGPEFDGSKIDFDIALKRMNTYKEEEKIKWSEMKEILK